MVVKLAMQTKVDTIVTNALALGCSCVIVDWHSGDAQ